MRQQHHDKDFRLVLLCFYTFQLLNGQNPNGIDGRRMDSPDNGQLDGMQYLKSWKVPGEKSIENIYAFVCEKEEEQLGQVSVEY